MHICIYIIIEQHTGRPGRGAADQAGRDAAAATAAAAALCCSMIIYIYI